MSLAFSDAAMRRFEKIVSRYPNKQAALLPVLHLAQEEFGYVPPEAMEYVGSLLDVVVVRGLYLLLAVLGGARGR